VRTLDYRPDYPYPGSAEAQARACCCPTIENELVAHFTLDQAIAAQRGAVPGYWVEDECPLHGIKVLA
jgi:hypothetical protein